MIEVIICTYNGEDFIEDQLISILNQNVTPDLISIYDDLSQDNTINIIESIKQKSNIDINITINKEQKGYRRNFLEAILKSESKFIFLSDQDDVWINTKIEIMSSNLRNSNVDAICSNSWITREDISQVQTTFFSQKKINISKFNKNPFLALMRTNSVSGSCLCFVNSTKLKRLLTTYFVEFEHDYQLGMIFSLIGRILLINDKLIYYRQHENNSLGIQSYSITDKFKKILFNKLDKNLIIEKIASFQKITPEINDMDKLILVEKELFFLKKMIAASYSFKGRIAFLVKNIIFILKTRRLKMGLNFFLNGFKTK
jgi:glycosyltransferase involved in cell wall biosynthesis